MTKNHMVDSVLALVLGTGAGMVLSVIGQKLINQHYLTNCHKLPNHNLVYVDGFLGDTYYCLNKAQFK